MFKGSGTYMDTASNTMDVLIVDEAHRLNEKSGFYQNQGENQVKEIIRAAKCSVFFLDRINASRSGTSATGRRFDVGRRLPARDLQN